jgi:uncharacterized membrane protein
MTNLPLPSPFRRRWFFQRSETDQVLTVASLFSCLLVVARVFHTGSLAFIFMPWNLFLAYVPYYISTMVTRKAARGNRLVTIIGLILWLLFIPNAFYILTDLYHLADGHRNSRIPEWFDLVLILSFAWSGLLLGVRSTRQVERILAPDASLPGRLVFIYPVMWLNALGVYIGRYLRYNSWDIVTNPVDLLSDIIRLIIHPIRHDGALGMIFCYSILLTIMYNLLNKNDGGIPVNKNPEPWKM